MEVKITGLTEEPDPLVQIKGRASTRRLLKILAAEYSCTMVDLLAFLVDREALRDRSDGPPHFYTLYTPLKREAGK